MDKKNNINKENGYYEHKPIREFKAKISKDGKFWLFKDITTHVVPRNYLSKIESEFVIEQSKSGGSQSVGSNRKVEQRDDLSN